MFLLLVKGMLLININDLSMLNVSIHTSALSSLFRSNKTIDYYLRSQYQDMRTSRLVTLGDLI